jgi:hypothetical protein
MGCILSPHYSVNNSWIFENGRKQVFSKQNSSTDFGSSSFDPRALVKQKSLSYSLLYYYPRIQKMWLIMCWSNIILLILKFRKEEFFQETIFYSFLPFNLYARSTQKLSRESANISWAIKRKGICIIIHIQDCHYNWTCKTNIPRNIGHICLYSLFNFDFALS